MLASYMVRPTEHAKTGLVKLIQYLVNTSHYGICMKCSRPGTRKLYDHVADNGCSDSETASLWRCIRMQIGAARRRTGDRMVERVTA